MGQILEMVDHRLEGSKQAKYLERFPYLFSYA